MASIPDQKKKNEYHVEMDHVETKLLLLLWAKPTAI